MHEYLKNGKNCTKELKKWIIYKSVKNSFPEIIMLNSNYITPKIYNFSFLFFPFLHIITVWMVKPEKKITQIISEY